MSLTGILYPKMIVNITTTLDEVLLQHAVVLKDQPEQDTHFVRAVRTGKRVFTNAGKHWLFQIKIYLYKYANAETKYLELKGYEGTKVYLHRHADGEMIYDTYNNAGAFILSSVAEEYTDEKNKYDVVILTFKSLNYIQAVIIPLPEGAVYYMNTLTDTPQGSSTSGVNISGKLHDMNNIPTDPPNYNESVPKTLRSGSVPVYVTVNGYKVWSADNNITMNTAWNVEGDILTGLTDLTFMISFRHAPIDNYYEAHHLMFHYTAGSAHSIGLRLVKGTGKVYAHMDSTTVESTLRYDDSEIHIAVVVYSQSTKTLKLFLEDGTSFTNVDSGFASFSLSTDIEAQPTIGARSTSASAHYGIFGLEELPGTEIDPIIGDILFFNGALMTSQINSRANWMANRLGITWNNIL